MSTVLGSDRSITAWLEAEAPEHAPDRVLNAARDRVRSTPQRRLLWPVRRNVQMNAYAKLAIAAAAVLVVAIVGLNLLPGGGGIGGPAATPTAAPTPTAIPTPTATAAPSQGLFPPPGPVPVGPLALVVNGHRFTMDIATNDWTGEIPAIAEGANLTKGAGHMRPDDGIWLPIWAADGVYSDPCRAIRGPKLSPSGSALAAAIAALPATDVVTAPKKVTIGGRDATYVAIRFHDDVGCAPGSYMMWWEHTPCDGSTQPCGRYVTAGGQTNHVWIFEIDGTHIFIEGETYKGAKPEVEQQLQQMIRSIRFT